MKPACQGIFVAGTDTEVGKTFVSAALLMGLRSRGVDAGYCKAVSTDGVEIEGRLVSPDALWVARACGLSDPPQKMNPFCLAHALSPLAAARLEDAAPRWDELIALIKLSLKGHEAFVCEGVGGVLVPLLPGRTALDLMAELGLGVVVAARPGLGTINHTLLTMQAVRQRGLELLGFIFSGREEHPERGARNALNSQLITEFSGVPFLGALPRLEEPDASQFERAVRDNLDIEPILAAIA